MAVIHGLLLITPPGGTIEVHPFDTFDAESLAAGAQRFAASLNLPMGSRAQVFDAASAPSFTLTGTWVQN